MPSHIQPLPRSKFASVTLEFQDANDHKHKPLPHTRVRVDLLDAKDNPSGMLFKGHTNAEGKVAVRIPISKTVAGEPSKRLPKIRIIVLDLDEDVLVEKDVKLKADKPILSIEVSIKSQDEKIKAPLNDDAKPVLGRSVSSTLRKLLKDNKLDSLAMVRGADKKLFMNLSGQDRTDIDELVTHAQLQLISRDHKINQKLVKAKCFSVFNIARQSRSEFVALVEKVQIDKDTAIRMHTTARRQVQALSNIYTEKLARSANGMAALSISTPAVTQPKAGGVAPISSSVAAVEPPCECNCNSAVSPQAYLVDLLDYAVDNVLVDGNSITLPTLERTFGQPFAALPVDCAFANLLVRQVRLCIEVLHQRNVLLGNDAVRAAAVTSALSAHATRAYEALLRSLGTSYRELRLIRSDDEALSRLANRLGVAPDHVDSFRLELNSADPDRQLNEAHLEGLFGLQSTARDPLSTGPKFKDGQGQITRWQLRGVEWRKNTDDLGRIHVSVVKQPSGKHEIIFFKDQNRDEASRIAIGSTTEAQGEVELTAENDSGLAGRMEFKYKSDDNNIYLAVVPEWAIRRKNQLQTLWQEADHPVPESEFAAPMVDPDIVDESELMQPYIENPAHKLWKARKLALEERRIELAALGSVTEMGAKEFPPAINLAKWEAIAIELQSADLEVVKIGTDRLEKLSLTQATFSFLLELAHREVKGQEVKAGEREQALDVLVNIYKASLSETWKTEERDNGIRLTAQFFLLSEKEPVLNPLRASAEARGNWRAELERNSAAPLIDPDIISESNFAPGDNSTPAYKIWTSRRELVGDGKRADDTNSPARVKGELFQAVAIIDDAAKLEVALTNGDLPPDQAPPDQAPLFHHIGFTVADMAGINEALEKGGTLPITPEQYGLTAAELRTLFKVRRPGAEADASDWEQVHHILVQAEKRRYLYPKWRIEENSDKITLNPDVFHLPSDEYLEMLPLRRLTPGFLQWRMDLRRQRAWRDQLKARIEQEHTVDLELQAAIDAAEEASLSALRDELLMATLSADKGGESLEERKRWVMNNLLINAFENGCRKTTRVAQAIETMQLLLWGIHSRQVEDKKFSLEPASAEAFAEEWQWLGSYATWRAAMFTYLYPENLLLPELRREIGDPHSDPTKLFLAILKVMSGETPPPLASEASGDEDDAPQPVEDEELGLILTDIFSVLGTTDPQTMNGQRKIYSQLLGSWRGRYRRVISTVEMGPIPDWENKWWAVTEFSQYNSLSAFLEDVNYVPLVFALNQLRQGKYEDALFWFGKVYDFRKTPTRESQGWDNPRLDLYFKQREATDSSGYASLDDWLSDNLNPHRIAATRAGADVRFVILAIIRCLLDYADSEFSKDVSESLARARELYETARRLLDSDQLGKKLGDCKDVIGTLVSEIGEDEWSEIVIPGLDLIQPPFVYPDSLSKKTRDRLLSELRKAVKPTNPPKPRSKVRQEVYTIVARHFVPKPPKTLEQSRLAGYHDTQAAYEGILSQPQVFRQIQLLGTGAPTASRLFVNAGLNQGGIDDKLGRGRWDRAPRVEFCIPRNPLITLLRMRFEVSWFKLNNCMNLAGQRREIPAYAAPTDTYSGLPMADLGAPIAAATAARLMPTLYRYRVLIERARQLVAMAQQMEATYLSFLEKRDLEAYTILRARQDLGVARANVTLQDLRVTEAEDGKDLAQAQFDRAEEAFTYYDGLIDDGLSGLELAALGSLALGALIQNAIAIAGAVASAVGTGGFAAIVSGAGTLGAGAPAGGAIGSLLGGAGGALAGAIVSGGQGLVTASSVFSMMASFERRAEEWEFQKDLADIDREIATVQQTLAMDRYKITLQEKRISEMSAENASDVVSFLNTKFTNAELYAWMGGIVGGIYRYLLQEAATIAKLAQRQLAFERQETELAVVLDDYWTYTDTSAILRGGSGSTDRRGMAGSARLLQDITRLDQEAFLTDRRKLQLSKTFSLALHDPIAFARFRESGELPFSTSLEQFDRNFPGHYLRLIKRVRVSVIALVPPTEGIRATLSSSGISRVVRGGDTFAETEIRRDPEVIAFTSSINATGLFELQEQPEMLMPFEGNGVAATGWRFSMPRAANIVDYSAIADVLLTIEYTALESAIYRSQVIQRLDRTMSGERPFSFRHQFADCWYDLNNPELSGDRLQMRVTFETRRSDFPPNVTDLRIEHVSLYFVRQDGFTDPIHVESLMFTESGHAGQIGGAATTNNGLISTREANAGNWLPMQGKQPIGKWDLNLLKPEPSKEDSDRVNGWFKNGKIEDILFVITFGGTTPEWPR